MKLVHDGLAPLANPENAKAMAAYLKTDQAFYGVRKPERAPTVKAMHKQFKPQTLADYQAAIRALWAQPQREVKYLALEYADRNKAFQVKEAMGLFEELIRDGQWWDFIDLVATNLVGRAFQKDRAALEPLLRQWNDDDDMWIRRTSILSQNRHREETDPALLFELCAPRAHEKEFFIRKAIGWALRDASRWYPGEVMAFVAAHRGPNAEQPLSGLSVREAKEGLERAGVWSD